MKLSSKQFSQRYPYWVNFGSAFYLFKDCEFNFIFRADLLFTDKSKSTLYFALYPDTFGVPFDKLQSASILRYNVSDYKFDLSNLISFIRSLTATQFNYFLHQCLISGHFCSSYNSFLIEIFHEFKR